MTKNDVLLDTILTASCILYETRHLLVCGRTEASKQCRCQWLGLCTCEVSSMSLNHTNI
jgi:hypothetical protein